MWLLEIVDKRKFPNQKEEIHKLFQFILSQIDVNISKLPTES